MSMRLKGQADHKANAHFERTTLPQFQVRNHSRGEVILLEEENLNEREVYSSTIHKRNGLQRVDNDSRGLTSNFSLKTSSIKSFQLKRRVHPATANTNKIHCLAKSSSFVVTVNPAILIGPCSLQGSGGRRGS